MWRHVLELDIQSQSETKYKQSCFDMKDHNRGVEMLNVMELLPNESFKYHVAIFHMKRLNGKHRIQYGWIK